MIYVIAFVVAAAIFLFCHFRGTAKREIEFRKAFNQRCLEDEREHQDQR
jgi:hypothetical protein